MNQTLFENILWQKIRKNQLGYKFRRQLGIGNYIVDFCCIEKKLILEIDGVQHEQNILQDKERTSFLESLDYTVLRFWNHEVRDDIESVVARIHQILQGKQPPHPSPPLFRGGKLDTQYFLRRSASDLPSR